ncbi:doublecortin domain-containing protein 2 isoform X2 [Poeciliopsis prolifica]|uniref:doublecortin domain-containing protein 2 isoform X2 n=1 Tax=Poeciliopsis prolifica TaxID=188132 RepID=UPI002413B9DC|nr:doublecortin domain-containing protein 2 isoform X2 [Poeciliopsis prolifica]XP_054909397.1 doublecortin domain-containing protein 2 isoform X2 [Poeciliopsis prolifica]
MAESPRITAPLPASRTVTVYRNGDAFYPGKKVVLNPRHLSTFDNFMNSLTRHVEAPFGAVRRLYTPTKGHTVQELDQLTHGGSYVAAGNEPFKVLDYYGITAIKPQRRKTAVILPVPPSKVVASSRWRKVKDGTCTINVFSNGDLRIPPARVRIPKFTLRNWDRVLSLVTHKVELRTGAVYKLYRLDGHPVNGSSELENNQHYVAAGPEKFKPLPYERKALLLSARNKRPVSKTVCDREDLELTVGGKMKEHAAKTERVKQPKKVSRKSARVTAGADSVFNATNKRSEVEGAAEVQEDPHLQVDLPIDEVEAETVEEEHEASTYTGNRKKLSATRPKKAKAGCGRIHLIEMDEKEKTEILKTVFRETQAF